MVSTEAPTALELEEEFVDDELEEELLFGATVFEVVMLPFVEEEVVELALTVAESDEVEVVVLVVAVDDEELDVVVVAL